MIDSIRSAIFLGVTIWILFFGVNFNGKHYGLDFSKNGVTFIWGR